jgi:hypothetical protein
MSYSLKVNIVSQESAVSIFTVEEGYNIFFRNIGNDLPDCTASSYSWPWESKISQTYEWLSVIVAEPKYISQSPCYIQASWKGTFFKFTLFLRAYYPRTKKLQGPIVSGASADFA